MKRTVALLLVALTALVASACVSTSQSRQPTQSSAPIASLALSVLPAPSWAASPFGSQPEGENVALHGYATGSTRDAAGLQAVDTATAHLAIDDDPSTVWSAQQPAPQWFSVALDDLYLVNRIQLEVTQAPAGPTSHEIWLGNGSGTRTLFASLRRVHTDDGQLLDIELSPPLAVDEVFVLTLDSPSWVAWREVKVFGIPITENAASIGAPRLTLQPAASGLHMPVQVTHANDNSGRLFVAEKEGRIRIVHDGATVDTPFLDIASRVLCCVHRGLIDVAFPPSHTAPDHFYISYTNLDGHTVISRFHVSHDPNRADPESEEVVLVIDQPAEHHNGGHLEFSPRDGFLYISSGDGGQFSYPDNPALQRDTLLSKLLRIDIESGVKPYSIPDTNPFAQSTGYRQEIWALGLRNPAISHLTRRPETSSSRIRETDAAKKSISRPLSAQEERTTAGSKWKPTSALTTLSRPAAPTPLQCRSPSTTTLRVAPSQAVLSTAVPGCPLCKGSFSSPISVAAASGD